MKLFSLSIVLKNGNTAVILDSATDLSSFGFFTRGPVQEFMKFTTITIIERLTPLTRDAVEEQGYRCYSYIRSDNIAAVVIADQEYPVRVAFTLLNTVLDDFVKTFPIETITAKTANKISFPILNEHLNHYQNPARADKLLMIQNELDETTVILHKTLESVLERGEKMEDLVQKSESLSSSSKMFYKQSKDANSCCTWM